MKTMSGACSWHVRIKVMHLSSVNQVLLMIDIRFRKLLPYMFTEGDV